MRLNARSFLLAVSAAASLIYLIAGPSLPFPAAVFAKCLAVTALGVLALCARKSFLAAGLLLGSFGDVLLELGRSYFLPGLAAFLTSHIVYATLFVRHRAHAGLAKQQLVWPAVLAVYGIGLGVWLSPALDTMRAPVFCYIAALVTMAATASRANYRSRLVFAGALLFLASDSLLGVDKFRMPIPYRGFAIWTSYYLAQCGIALGVLDDERG